MAQTEKVKRQPGRPRLGGTRAEVSLYATPEHVERWRLLAKKWKCSLSEAGRRALDQAADREGVEAMEPSPSTTPLADSLLAMVEEVRAMAPPEAWDAVPPDLAVNHDHYLYGAPKRTA